MKCTEQKSSLFPIAELGQCFEGTPAKTKLLLRGFAVAGVNAEKY